MCVFAWFQWSYQITYYAFNNPQQKEGEDDGVVWWLLHKGERGWEWGGGGSGGNS